MAKRIPVEGKTKKIDEVCLTLTKMQTIVGGFIKFITLPSGDLLVVNEAHLDGAAPYNPSASSFAGSLGPIHGDAILCTPDEIA